MHFSLTSASGNPCRRGRGINFVPIRYSRALAASPIYDTLSSNAIYMLISPSPALPTLRLRVVRQVYHQAAMAACIGYVYCLLFALSGSLVPTVLLHSLNNVTALFFCSYDTLYNSPNSNCAHDLMVGVTADVISAPPNAASMDSSSLKTDATPSRGRCCNGWTGLTWIGAQLATAGVYALVGTACLKRVRSLDRKHSLEEMSAAPTTAPPRSCGSKAT